MRISPPVDYDPAMLTMPTKVAALQQQLEAMASPAARAAIMKQLAVNDSQAMAAKASQKGLKTSPLSGSRFSGADDHRDELLKKKVTAVLSPHLPSHH
jgi:hypothetical protein